MWRGSQPCAQRPGGGQPGDPLRRRALNLLNQDRTKQRGIKGKQLNASWDHAYLLRLLAF